MIAQARKNQKILERTSNSRKFTAVHLTETRFCRILKTMHKRSSKKPEQKNKLPDVAEQAADQPPAGLPSVVLPPTEKNPAAVALGRLGGQKGGPARARKLSAERRIEIAAKAARTRWSRKKNT
jgi:hypothetical protein